MKLLAVALLFTTVAFSLLLLSHPASVAAAAAAAWPSDATATLTVSDQALAPAFDSPVVAVSDKEIVFLSSSGGVLVNASFVDSSTRTTQLPAVDSASVDSSYAPQIVASPAKTVLALLPGNGAAFAMQAGTIGRLMVEENKPVTGVTAAAVSSSYVVVIASASSQDSVSLFSSSNTQKPPLWTATAASLGRSAGSKLLVPTSCAAVFEDMVFLVAASTSEDFRAVILALNATNGQISNRWKSGSKGFPLDRAPRRFAAPVVVAAGTSAVLVYAGGDHTVWGLDVRTGEPRWKHLTSNDRKYILNPNGGVAFSSSAATVVVHSGASKTVVALDPFATTDSAALRWKISNEMLGNFVNVSSAPVITAPFGAVVVALDPQQGANGVAVLDAGNKGDVLTTFRMPDKNVKALSAAASGGVSCVANSSVFYFRAQQPAQTPETAAPSTTSSTEAPPSTTAAPSETTNAPSTEAPATTTTTTTAPAPTPTTTADAAAAPTPAPTATTSAPTQAEETTAPTPAPTPAPTTTTTTPAPTTAAPTPAPTTPVPPPPTTASPTTTTTLRPRPLTRSPQEQRTSSGGMGKYLFIIVLIILAVSAYRFREQLPGLARRAMEIINDHAGGGDDDDDNGGAASSTSAVADTNNNNNNSSPAIVVGGAGSNRNSTAKMGHDFVDDEDEMNQIHGTMHHDDAAAADDGFDDKKPLVGQSQQQQQPQPQPIRGPSTASSSHHVSPTAAASEPVVPIKKPGGKGFHKRKNSNENLSGTGAKRNNNNNNNNSGASVRGGAQVAGGARSKPQFQPSVLDTDAADELFGSSANKNTGSKPVAKPTATVAAPAPQPEPKPAASTPAASGWAWDGGDDDADDW